MESANPLVAVQINHFPDDNGLRVVPFSRYDLENRIATQIGSFVIPWHELHDVIDRMERIEKSKLDVDSGAEPF